MPIYKTLSDRLQKYEAKFDPNVVKSRFTAVKPIAEQRYMDTVPAFVTVREFVRDILNRNGVAPGLHAVYYSFAFRIMKKAQKHRGETLTTEIEGEKEYWVVTHGADPAILDQIINIVQSVSA